MNYVKGKLSNVLNAADLQKEIEELQQKTNNLEKNKQNKLISGETIRTLDEESLLGSGDIGLKTIDDIRLIGDENIELKTVNGSKIIGHGNFKVKTLNGVDILVEEHDIGDVSDNIELKTLNGEDLMGPGNIETKNLTLKVSQDSVEDLVYNGTENKELSVVTLDIDQSITSKKVFTINPEFNTKHLDIDYNGINIYDVLGSNNYTSTFGGNEICFTLTSDGQVLGQSKLDSDSLSLVASQPAITLQATGANIKYTFGIDTEFNKALITWADLNNDTSYTLVLPAENGILATSNEVEDLQSQISIEVERATGAEADLQNAIDAEAARATEAESALDARTTILEGWKSALNIENGSAEGSLQQRTDTDTFILDNQKSTRHEETIYVGAAGQYSTELGGKSKAEGKRAVAEGTQTIAQGNYSHAEGNNSVAVGNNSHAEGLQNVAQGSASHAEGQNSIARGNCSHAEGNNVQAVGAASHAEGTSNIAHGNYSHVGGRSTEAHGEGAFAHGYGIYVNQDYQTAFGKYNEVNANTIFSVGNGTAANARSNAFEVHKDGSVRAYRAPNNENDLTNKKYVDNLVSSEASIRLEKDNDLQSQIDAIESKADVVDVVPCYDYNETTITPKPDTDIAHYNADHPGVLTDQDVIKVLDDELHGDATTYYRWVITEGVGAWTFVGAIGPYVTLHGEQTIDGTKTFFYSNDLIYQNYATVRGDKIELSYFNSGQEQYKSSLTAGELNIEGLYADLNLETGVSKFKIHLDAGDGGSVPVEFRLSDINDNNYTLDIPYKNGTLSTIEDFEIETSKHQSTSVVVKDAITNINDRVFQHYTANLITAGRFTFYQILKDGNNPTEEEAKEYMCYMTGSTFLPKYNYDFPKQTIFTFADRSTWKPQYSKADGLRLYRLTTSVALDSDVVHKGAYLSQSDESIYGTKNIFGDIQLNEYYTDGEEEPINHNPSIKFEAPSGSIDNLYGNLTVHGNFAWANLGGGLDLTAALSYTSSQANKIYMRAPGETAPTDWEPGISFVTTDTKYNNSTEQYEYRKGYAKLPTNDGSTANNYYTIATEEYVDSKTDFSDHITIGGVTLTKDDLQKLLDLLDSLETINSSEGE